jgi:hypothetical protein
MEPNLAGSIYVRSSIKVITKLPNSEQSYKGKVKTHSLAPFGQVVSEEKICLILANQKQELPLAAIFVGGMGRNEETL